MASHTALGQPTRDHDEVDPRTRLLRLACVASPEPGKLHLAVGKGSSSGRGCPVSMAFEVGRRYSAFARPAVTSPLAMCPRPFNPGFNPCPIERFHAGVEKKAFLSRRVSGVVLVRAPRKQRPCHCLATLHRVCRMEPLSSPGSYTDPARPTTTPGALAGVLSGASRGDPCRGEARHHPAHPGTNDAAKPTCSRPRINTTHQTRLTQRAAGLIHSESGGNEVNPIIEW